MGPGRLAGYLQDSGNRRNGARVFQQAARRSRAGREASSVMRESDLLQSEVPPKRASWPVMACEPEVVRRSLGIAAVVGTLLVVINYGDRALAGAIGPGDWVKIVLTYCVPYGVATYAAVQAIRQRR